MDNEDLLIKAAALIVSLLVLLKGITEYSKAQKWKKLEFVSKEIKEFFNDPDIKRALILVDWNACTFKLNEGEITGKTELKFNDSHILSALTTHHQNQQFTHEDRFLKTLFDALFDRLTMFENYIETGLIKAKDIQPYLVYYVDILADPKNNRKPKEVKEQLWKYIDEYGYDKVRSLCFRKEFTRVQAPKNKS